MERVLVTGGAGFIGSHLVDALLAGGAEVLVLDNLSTGSLDNLRQWLSLRQSLGNKQGASKLSVLEQALESSDTPKIIAEFKPELIFHTAAQANVRHSVADPISDASSNILGTINVLEGARLSKPRGLLFSSTGGAVYGEQEILPALETHSTTPECPYGLSKRAGELYVEYYARIHSIPSVALRYANVYGPRQNPKAEAGVIAVFLERLFAGEDLLVNGDGLQTRDFVYIADVIRANLLAASALMAAEFRPKRNYAVFNVGCEVETSVIDIVNALKQVWREVFPEAREINFSYAPAQPGEQRRSVIDCQAIKQALGWEAQIELAHGLALTVKSSQK